MAGTGIYNTSGASSNKQAYEIVGPEIDSMTASHNQSGSDAIGEDPVLSSYSSYSEIEQRSLSFLDIRESSIGIISQSNSTSLNGSGTFSGYDGVFSGFSVPGTKSSSYDIKLKDFQYQLLQDSTSGLTGGAFSFAVDTAPLFVPNPSKTVEVDYFDFPVFSLNLLFPMIPGLSPVQLDHAGYPFISHRKPTLTVTSHNYDFVVTSTDPYINHYAPRPLLDTEIGLYGDNAYFSAIKLV